MTKLVIKHEMSTKQKKEVELYPLLFFYLVLICKFIFFLSPVY